MKTVHIKGAVIYVFGDKADGFIGRFIDENSILPGMDRDCRCSIAVLTGGADLSDSDKDQLCNLLPDVIVSSRDSEFCDGLTRPFKGAKVVSNHPLSIYTIVPPQLGFPAVFDTETIESNMASIIDAAVMVSRYEKDIV